MIKRHPLFFASVFVFALAAAVFFTLFAGVVGSTYIRRSDVQYRDAVTCVYYPSEKRSLGFQLLATSTLHCEVLKKYGYPVDEVEVRTEADRIDKSTRDPEKLQVIKEIFGPNIQAYLRVYVRSTLCDRMVYEQFLKNTDIQHPIFAAAQEFIRQTSAGGLFAERAVTMGIPIRNLIISSKSGLTWALPETEKAALPPGYTPLPQNSSTVEAKGWIEGPLKELKAGDVVPLPIDRDQSVLAARLLQVRSSKNGSVYTLEAAVFDKLNFSRWLEQERRKITFIEF